MSYHHTTVTTTIESMWGNCPVEPIIRNQNQGCLHRASSTSEHSTIGSVCSYSDTQQNPRNAFGHNDGTIDAGEPVEEEFHVLDHVLVVPRRLTRYAQNIVFPKRAAPATWNLEGRFGSRTFHVDKDHMGIPLVAEQLVLDLARKHTDLDELLQMPGVELRHIPYVEPPKHRARELPYIDATIHPERAPANFDLERQKEEAQRYMLLILKDEFHLQPPKFTYAELFAGMGGFGVALDALGGRCVFCSELEDHLRELYRYNFVTKPNRQRQQRANNTQLTGDTLEPIEIPIHGDIYTIPDNDFPRSVDLLVAGFPCQPFSALGQQPGFDCPKSGNLFLEIVRILKVSQPKAFILENVPGLVSMTETFDTIVAALKEARYDVFTEVISARGLTATARKRLFFVGIRRKTNSTAETKASVSKVVTEKCFEFPFIPDLQLRARHVLDYDEVPAEELNILRLSDETFKRLLESGRFRTHSLAWPNKNLDTLTSHYGNAIGRGESQLVPSRASSPPRRFSVRECARIMGFPNSFEFLPPRDGQGEMGYRKQHFRMIGNAVCPPVIAALAGAVLECCPEICFWNTTGDDDWVQRGRSVAIGLALNATRTTPAAVPRGCLIPSEYRLYGY